MSDGDILMIEIRAAEGGDDAKLLVKDQAAIYAAACKCRHIPVEIVSERKGQIVLEVPGVRAASFFSFESGGHRWQRVPPTEKRGRRHTSTVTVAVLPVLNKEIASLQDKDIEWKATRGSGKGGQHRNVTDSAVQMRHKPTGIAVRIEGTRSQLQNRITARNLLAARVADFNRAALRASRASDRREQVGSGQRGDKIRTIRLQDGVVVDHRSGKRTSTARYLAGHLEDLLP